MINNQNITFIIPFTNKGYNIHNLDALLKSFNDQNISVILIEQLISEKERLQLKYNNIMYLGMKYGLSVKEMNKCEMINIASNYVKTEYMGIINSNIILDLKKILDKIPDQTNYINLLESKDQTCGVIVNKSFFDKSGGIDENYTGYTIKNSNRKNIFNIYLNKDNIIYLNIDEEDMENYFLRHSENIEYNIPNKKDTIIVISYFSPCNYQLPRQNLLEIVKHLTKYSHPVCVVEAIMPNSDCLNLPNDVIHYTINATEKSYLFLKENLYNIAIKKLNYKKYIFLDGDIYFDDKDWFDKTSELLDDNDIIQPFEYCFWSKRDRKGYFLKKLCSAKCLFENVTSTFNIYHPGFTWAMTKDFLDSIGGLYDEHPMGAADSGLWFALDKKYPEEITVYQWANCNNIFYHTETFQNFRSKVLQYNPRISYLKNCNVYHLWHGDRKDRKYIDRYKNLPPLINNNYPLTRNKDGLLEWINIEDSKKALQYFIDRKEDG